MRLAEVMAYADIPPSMRPALSEFDPLAHLHLGAGAGAGAQPLLLPAGNAQGAAPGVWCGIAVLTGAVWFILCGLRFLSPVGLACAAAICDPRSATPTSQQETPTSPPPPDPGGAATTPAGGPGGGFFGGGGAGGAGGGGGNARAPAGPQPPGGGGGNLRAMQLEAIKGQLLRSLATLRGVKEGGAGGPVPPGGSPLEGRHGGMAAVAAGRDHDALLDSLAAQLTDCQQVGAVWGSVGMSGWLVVVWGGGSVLVEVC